ncbi:MAG: hypothetical protein FWG26_07780 [Betaproteobacteria bacterium]|nr:hypothetical protein [Betaproteobacteria bacterium]
MDAPLILTLKESGILLSVSPSGELTAKGKPESLRRFQSFIKENKAALLAELAQAEELLSYWWRLHFPDGGALEVFSPSGNTHTSILKGYPEAISVEPFTLGHTMPDAPLSEKEAAAIVLWLASIGERSQEIIDDVLSQCERSAEARGYYLRRAEGKPG